MYITAMETNYWLDFIDLLSFVNLWVHCPEFDEDGKLLFELLELRVVAPLIVDLPEFIIINNLLKID